MCTVSAKPPAKPSAKPPAKPLTKKSPLKQNSADSFATLGNDIATCTTCPRLISWCQKVAVDKRASYANDTYWGRPVPGFGDPLASVLVLGLAPAAHGANRTGRVFTGDRSGDWLFRAMHRAGFANQATSTTATDGLKLTGAYVNAAVRCAPPDNKPEPGERDACKPFLDRELALLTELRVIIALGQFAYDAVGRHVSLHKPKPKFGHGVEATGILSTPNGERPVTVVCSFHPSQQNTFTGRLTEPMFDAIFSRARTLADTPANSEK
jgi:uracil-DNA glycosylase